MPPEYIDRDEFGMYCESQRESNKLFVQLLDARLTRIENSLAVLSEKIDARGAGYATREEIETTRENLSKVTHKVYTGIGIITGLNLALSVFALVATFIR